ncbi:hypothetical protein HHX47_DHR2001182 [Lentinula edodes]|nr:hypothetical protein HHX47_DHR2001182 [Lentinula edodes]
MPTKTDIRGAPVFKYRFILIRSLFSLFLFTASTTAIPVAAPVSVKIQERSLRQFNPFQSSLAGQPDVDHAISSGAQQSTVSKLLETRGQKSRREEEAAQKFSEALVEEVLTIALPVLHPTSPNAYFEIDKVIGYPTRLADHEPFSVSFKKQGPHGPEYDLYQGWFFRTTVPVTGEIRTAGLKTLVARVENGNLVYPKVFHVPFELGIRTEASIRRNKILDSDTKIVL